MYSSTLLLLSLASSAIAISNSTLHSNSASGGSSTSTLYSNCHTRQGYESVALVPTLTLVATAFATVSSNVTITPAPTTVYPPALNITQTLISTITAPAETTTITIPGSTISTSVGFTPIASRLAAATINPIKRNVGHPHGRPKQHHETHHETADDECEREQPRPYNAIFDHHHPKPVFDPEVYPQEVTCYESIEIISTAVITITASVQTVTAPPSTVTDYIYSTTTTTPVIYATATASVVYAGCLSNNIIAQVNGQSIYGVQAYAASVSSTFSFVTANTGYECCVACWNQGFCAGATFFGGGTCVLVVASTCSPSTEAGVLYTEATLNGVAGITASNGNCGYLGATSG